MKTKITLGLIVYFTLIFNASIYAQLFKQLDQAYDRGQIFLGCQEPLLDRKTNKIRKYWLAVTVVLLEKKHSDNLFS